MPIFTSHVSASSAVTASQYKVDTSLLPDANDGASIGAAGAAFSDVFLAEGGVINWDSGDATLTQAGNVVTLAGATFAGTLSTAAQTNITSLGTLSALTVSGVGIDIDDTSASGGTMDGVVIGNSTAVGGTFTTLASTGNTTIGNASGDSLTINAANIQVDNIAAGTDNSVVVAFDDGGNGFYLRTDEIDSRVWGTTLVNTASTGTPANNQLAVFTDANTVEGDSKVTWDGATFAIDGDLRAINYIVSSSITHMTQSFSSGSTIFGDTLDDRHEFTGSLFTKGTGSFDNGINATLLTAAQPNITSVGTLSALSGSSTSTGSFGRVEAAKLDVRYAGAAIQGGLEVNTSSDLGHLDIPSNGAGTLNGVAIGSAAGKEQTGAFTTVTTTGNVSGSLTSTGSFGYLVGDGGGITGLTSAAISSVAGMTNNNILTATGAASVTGESDFAFISATERASGALLTVTGASTTTGTSTFGSLSDGTITITAFESSLTSGAALIPTSAAVKTYVDAQVTAQDLDITDDLDNVIAIDLDSELLQFIGGTNMNTVASGNGVTHNVDASPTFAGTVQAAGNISGSSTSTGSFGYIYTAGGGVSAGTILPSADNSYDLGSATYRFANLYVGDLMMSNKSRGGNEVDGTYGDYTIQEGEEDLFLLNHRNGKTYKFRLEEVDSRPWYKKIFS